MDATFFHADGLSTPDEESPEDTIRGIALVLSDAEVVSTQWLYQYQCVAAQALSSSKLHSYFVLAHVSKLLGISHSYHRFQVRNI
jgi:hypothetical protein